MIIVGTKAIIEWTCEDGMRIPTCQEQVKTVGFTAKRGVVIEYIDKPLSVTMAVFVIFPISSR